MRIEKHLKLFLEAEYGRKGRSIKLNYIYVCKVNREWMIEVEEAIKIKGIGEFMKEIERKDSNYVWVIEENEGEEFFYLITDYNYNYGWLRKKWNVFMKFNEDLESVHVDKLTERSYKNRIKFILKDKEGQIYGMNNNVLERYKVYIEKENKEVKRMIVEPEKKRVRLQ